MKQTTNKQTDKKKKGKSDSKKTPDSVPPTKPKPKRIHGSLTSALAAYQIPVNPQGTLRHYLEHYGVPTTLLEDWHDPNPRGHPVAHTLRLWSVVQILRDLTARNGLNRQAILDWYGRDWKAFRLPVSEEVVGVTFHPLRPAVYAGDPSRAVWTDTPTPARFTAALAVDIYLHKTQTQPFGPNQVAEVAAELQIPLVYVVTQDLSELYGSHVHYAEVTTGEERRMITSSEGSWESIEIQGRRHVVFKPDQGTLPYPPHAFHRWGGTECVATSHGYLHVHQMTSLGFYQIFVCHLEEEKPEPIQQNPQPVVRYRNMPDDQYAWVRDMVKLTAQVSSYIPKALLASATGVGTSGFQNLARPGGLIAVNGMRPVDTDALAVLSTTFAGKQLHGRSFTSMVATVERIVAQNPLLATRYPQISSAMVLNTVFTYLASRPEDGMIEACVRDFDHAAESKRNQLSSGKIEPTFLASYGRPLCVAAATAALAFAWWRGWLSPRDGPLASFFSDIRAGWQQELAPGPLKAALDFVSSRAHLLGTASEEVFKYSFGWGGNLVLNALETVNSYLGRQAAGLPTSFTDMLMVRGPPVAFHVLTGLAYSLFGFKALPLAIPAHWAFNGAILYASMVIPSYAQLCWGVKITQLPLENCQSAMAWSCFPWWCMPARTKEKAIAWMRAVATRMSACFWGASTYIFGISDQRHNHDGHQAYALAMARAARWTGVDDMTRTWETVVPVAEARLTATRPTPWIDEFDRRRAGNQATMGKYLDWRVQMCTVTVEGIVYRPFHMERRALELLNEKLMHTSMPCDCQGINMPEDMCPACNYTPEGDFMYPLMITSGMLFKPSNSPASALAAIMLRWYFTNNLNDTSPAKESEFAAKTYSQLQFSTTFLRNCYQSSVKHVNWSTVEECAAAMPSSKRARLLAGDKEGKLTGVDTRAAVFPKHNETVKADRSGMSAHPEPSVKTRLVIDVPSGAQAVILPKSRAYTKELKNAFDGSAVHTIGKYRVRLVITKQKKKNLDAYGFLAQTVDEMCIFVSCDDTIVFTGMYAVEFGCCVFESDYSSYDQTQRRGLWERLWEILDDGSQSFAEWRELHTEINMGTGTFRYKRTAVTISAPLRYAMRTGVGSTSIFGSLINLLAIVYWLERRSRDGVGFSAAVADLGLEAKVIEHASPLTATFLKGVFLRSGWSPLVSSCLKLGKTMKAAESLEGLFFGVMQSVKVPDDFPILGAMRIKAEQLVGSRDAVIANPAMARSFRQSNDPNFIENRYKVLESQASREEVLEHLLARYEITESEILSAEHLIMSVQRLPVMLIHPVFLRLRDVDYE